MKRILVGLALVGCSSAALAQSTTTYTYDGSGRLVRSATDKGPGASNVTIQYDPANNPMSYNVTGARDRTDQGSEVSVPTNARIIVVPLNGFTLIPVYQSSGASPALYVAGMTMSCLKVALKNLTCSARTG